MPEGATEVKAELIEIPIPGYLDEAENFPCELADALDTLERIAEDLDELKQYLEGSEI